MMFVLFMIVILLLTGVIWLLDMLFFAKKRGINQKEPVIVEYAKSFFPVILLVFVIRSFIVEPFKIPSGSMIPTLLVGDYILVKKFAYGLRVPILGNVFLPLGRPERGDVVVFHYPPEPSIDYIKRVVGVPGDKIQYQDKQLTINGNVIEQSVVGDYEYLSRGLSVTTTIERKEVLGEVEHKLLASETPIPYQDSRMIGYQMQEGGTITVPEGQYFVMGDNRDNSADSRFWGFVPDQNLVGKAFYIWMNFDYVSKIFTEDGRIGTSIQ